MFLYIKDTGNRAIKLIFIASFVQKIWCKILLGNLARALGYRRGKKKCKHEHHPDAIPPVLLGLGELSITAALNIH